MITPKGEGIAAEPFTTGFKYTTAFTITLCRLKRLRKPQRDNEQREKWRNYNSQAK
jgi:hypothetical protein